MNRLLPLALVLLIFFMACEENPETIIITKVDTVFITQTDTIYLTQPIEIPFKPGDLYRFDSLPTYEKLDSAILYLFDPIRGNSMLHMELDWYQGGNAIGGSGLEVNIFYGDLYNDWINNEDGIVGQVYYWIDHEGSLAFWAYPTSEGTYEVGFPYPSPYYYDASKQDVTYTMSKIN